MPEEPDLPDAPESAAQPQPTEAIDPTIDDTSSPVALDPVVRSTASPQRGHTGFVRSLTSSIASSWNSAREAQEQDEEWDEAPTPVDGAARRSESTPEADRHEFAPDAFWSAHGDQEPSPRETAGHEAHPATGAVDLRPLGGYDPQTSTYTFHDPTPTHRPTTDRSAGERTYGEWGHDARHHQAWHLSDGGRVHSPAVGSIPIIDPHTGLPALPGEPPAKPSTSSSVPGGPAALTAPAAPTAPTTPPTGPQDDAAAGDGAASHGVEAPPAGPTSPISRPGEPLRRRSVLRSSPRGSGRSGRPLFDRGVFDQKVRPESVLRRLMRPEAPMTSAIPIVDHLAGTPFENPRQAEAPVDTDELETIAFVLDIGEALFRYGAGALEVETSIIAITAAFGMKNTDVDITNQSISLNWAPEGKIPYSRVRVVRSWSSNFQALAGVHHLVTDIISGRLTRTEAAGQLEEITHEPKPFPRWMVTLAGAVFASAFASFLGAPLLDATIGFFATLLVLATTRRLSNLKVPEFYCLSAGGFVATFIAMGAVALEIPVEPFHVVAGGLMIMLPSVRVVSAIQDAINGFPLTSAGRIVSSLIAFIGLTSGIMVAVITASQLGTPEIEPARALERLYPFPVLVALVFVAAVAAAIVEQARWRILVPIGAVSALGFCAFYAAELTGLGERVTPVIGGIVVGTLGRLVALRMNAPQLVVAVPAMMFMLPGLMVFRGMYSVAMRTETDVLAGLPVGVRQSAEILDQVPIGMLTGLADLFNAMIIILGIAGGIVLGDVMMRPFTSAIQSHERRRFRNR
ncbi:MAG: threonine/serine exporter family protein [Brachybacterium sp.]|nr:threonine/serine exporter family protein [Brachybacterium sp.]